MILLISTMASFEWFCLSLQWQCLANVCHHWPYWMRPTYRWRPFVGKPFSLQPIGYINLSLRSQGNPTLFFLVTVWRTRWDRWKQKKSSKRRESRRGRFSRRLGRLPPKRGIIRMERERPRSQKNWKGFPQTVCECQHHFGETGLLQEGEVVHQTIKVPFLPQQTPPIP